MNNFWIELVLTIAVALAYLSDFLKNYIPTGMFTFLQDNQSTILGIYYLFLAYRVYTKYVKKNSAV